MKTVVVKNSEISENLLTKVAALKSVRWPYPIDNQLNWMKNNLHSEDLHVLVYDDEQELIAYTNLVEIKVEINGEELDFRGIGNVCTSQSGKGYGNILMNEVNKVLKENHFQGLLLCKDHLVAYYEKFGWVLIEKQNIFSDSFKTVNTMIHRLGVPVKSLVYNDRNF